MHPSTRPSFFHPPLSISPFKKPYWALVFQLWGWTAEPEMMRSCTDSAVTISGFVGRQKGWQEHEKKKREWLGSVYPQRGRKNEKPSKATRRMDHFFFQCFLLPLPVPGKLRLHSRMMWEGGRDGNTLMAVISAKSPAASMLPHQWLVPVCVVLELSVAFASGDQL